MSSSIDELWLSTLQRLAAHVAHDLKGALNAASVNLEVVRARSEKETVAGVDISRFAVNAADQLSVVIRVTGALLSLARGTRGPVEASLVTKQLVHLLDDMKTGQGGRITLTVEGGLSAETSAPLSAVRLAVGASLLSALAGDGPVSIQVRGMPTPHVYIGTATPSALPEEVAEAIAIAGIQIHTDGHGISISLPGPSDQRAPAS